MDTPETPSEIAKRMWDTAIEHINSAVECTDIVESNAYASVAQTCVTIAQFALMNPSVVLGIPADPAPVNPAHYGLPPGAPPIPSSMQSSLPPGAPPIPMWGTSK